VGIEHLVGLLQFHEERIEMPPEFAGKRAVVDWTF
jgi:hypothetical protein